MIWGSGFTERSKRLAAEEMLGAALLLAMVAVLFVQVFARFIVGDSLSWSEELARYLFIWMIFLCLGVATLRGSHVAIDIFTDRLPPRLHRVVAQACHGIAFAINGLLLVLGVRIAYVIGDLGQSSAALGLPMWIVYSALPLGMGLSMVRTVQASCALWRNVTEPSMSEEYGGER